MATTRTTPAQFFRQVRLEVSKVTWPSRKETMITTAMVFFMAVLASMFFLAVDWIVSNAVALILGIRA